jgi:hypothetical protein
MSASYYENFKSVFGYQSSNVVEDKKRKVDGVLTVLEKAMEGLQETTKKAQMTYHPGKVDNAEEYKSMRERFAKVETLDLEPNDAYAAYDAIEKQANVARATVFALHEADKRIVDIKKMAPEAIDEMVENIETDMMLGAPGGLNGDEERGALIAAIKVRYDIDELAGDLPHDVLLRFYHVLSLVPKNHTKDNPKLKVIKRSSMSDTSLYYQDGSGTIAINGGEVGGGPFGSSREKYSDGAGTELKLDRFDAHTLHEVGHSVDDACGFMALHSKKTDFGGWASSSYAEAVDVGVKRVKGKFSAIAPVALTRLLQQSMSQKTFDQAIEDWKRQSANMGRVDRETLLADAAVQAADAIIRETKESNTLPLNTVALTTFTDALRVAKLIPLSKLKGKQLEVIKAFISSMKDQFRRSAELAYEMAAAAAALRDETALRTAWDELSAWGKAITKELWWAGPSKIAEMSFGGRVYQEDGSKWWSYDIGARGAMVKDYQFRSPSEWFAEVYAVEMLGNLSDGHPCKRLIRGLDSTQKLTE